jgi:MraZ protein
LGTSEILKTDSEGRVMLTETMKAFAGIASEATFVGQGHKFQIWEPSRFRAHLEEAKARVREMRKQFGELAGAQPPPRGARE